MGSIHTEHSDLDDDKSIILETRLSDIQIREYGDTLKLLADSNSLTYNYALEETIRLMENLVGRPKEDTEDKKVINFAFQAAGYLSDYEWTYYDDSTIAQLEFFLRAMSSVLHILSKSIKMIDANLRTSFYKSVSKFWGIYRNTNIINANIMFRLREIRNCLRKIKDDKSNADFALKLGGNFFQVVVSVAQKEYLAALASFIKVLDFEYSAGEWYFRWLHRREKFFLLCSENSHESESIRKFYRKLFRSSKKELIKVKRKNTKFRKFEYKMLKSGGLVTGSSLPDNIDTLLIGYLHLIQQLYENFFPQLNGYIKDFISFCNEIVETHVKKQLTFKAIEILYFIKESIEDEEIKDEIEINFESWSDCHIPSTTLPSRPLSAPSSFHYPNPTSQNNDTPISAYTSLPSRSQSLYNPSSKTTPSRTLTPLSQEENREEKQKQRRKLNVRAIPTKVTRSLSSFQQQCTRKRIIDDVKKLFGERLKIHKDIDQIKKQYDELLLVEEVKDKDVVDKNSNNFSDLILSKLKEILEEKRREALPSIPQFPHIEIPFVSDPESIYNNESKSKKNVYNPYPEKERRGSYEVKTREIIVYKVINNNEDVINKNVNNPEEKEESKVGVYKEINNDEEVVNKNVDDPEEVDAKLPETILSKEINEVTMNPHLEEVKDDNIDDEENEKEECEKSDESNNVLYESQSEIKNDDNNMDDKEDEKEECEKSDESNNVLNEPSESQSEIKNDNNNMESDESHNVHNEPSECGKSDDGDSVHSVGQSVNPPEIIFSPSEDSEVKDVKDVTLNQINQINQVNQYNIVNNVINNVQQPVEEESSLLRTFRKIVKEVENIVDKATRAHQAAVLKSSSSLSVNVLEEGAEEEVVEKEEVIEEVVVEEVVEEIVEKEVVIEKIAENEEIVL